jgi:hypothetical protein
MSSEQFELLLTDVSVNGVIEPIVMFEGKILDGNNRYKAHRAGGGIHKLPTVEFEGTRAEALAYVLSRNQYRRHMSSAERAILSVRALEEAKNNPELLAGPNFYLEAQSEAVVTRRGRAMGHVWPPREGFPVWAPETLKAYAREHGIENVAQAAPQDDGTFDNSEWLAEAEKLIEQGLITPDDIPRDIPEPEKQDRAFLDRTAQKAAEVFLDPRAQNSEPKRGRRKNPVYELAGPEVSRTTVKRAVRVERDGSDELKAALDAKVVSLRKAAEIAGLPKEEQAEAISVLSSEKPAGAISGPRAQKSPARKSKVPALIKQLEQFARRPEEYIGDARVEELEHLARALVEAANAARMLAGKPE